MCPRPASIISGAKALIIRKGARRFVSINRSQSPTAVSCSGRPWLLTPALFTRMSQRP